MKNANTIPAIILFVAAGCGGGKQAGSDDLITIDVTKSYPKKELILQDFMDVEYIPLESSDEFLTQGFVQAVGKDIIVVKNYAHDGNIFIFDRKGKGLRKINRTGQGGEEYTRIYWITLDEDKGEIFVYSRVTRKILVYDLDGNFKRSFNIKEGFTYSKIYNFDRDNLICLNDFYNYVKDGKATEQPFMIISKQDGSITQEIQIPFKEKIKTVFMYRDEAAGITYSTEPYTYYPIIPSFNSWILIEPSSDTIYNYLPDHTMTPFMARTPSVQSMDDPKELLFLSVLTDRYYFMETVKNIYDFGTKKGFPGTNLMYDRKEKAIFKCVVYNDDYSNKKQVYMNSDPVNAEIATWQPLDADRLVESYKKGELKGKLKEIAATLDEESNPVIMLLKHKKQ
ncbi:MAG: 6-bladed beta-propeller [Tannerella sp.]|jgi:hypothetical protein|nr:6-bladed beta-propeller [Tannerella sp.]